MRSQNSTPPITIITPSFNQGGFLEATITSVLNQNYPNLQYIIIDGGSTDNSVEIIKKYQDKIDYWVSEPDHGQSHAINKGLSLANGEIVTWLNSDDLLEPGSLETIANYFHNHTDCAFLHGKAILFGKNHKNKVIGNLQNDIPNRYLAYIPFPQPASFFKRKLITDLGFLNESLHYGMDYEFLCRVRLSGQSIEHIETILAKYRLHDSGKTNDFIKFCDEWAMIYSKVLRSFEDQTQDLISSFCKLGLYQDGKDCFDSKIKLTRDELLKQFLYHLEIQIHLRYQHNDFVTAKNCIQYIHTNHPEFYSSQKLNKIAFRINYIPKFIIKFIREITA